MPATVIKPIPADSAHSFVPPPEPHESWMTEILLVCGRRSNGCPRSMSWRGQLVRPKHGPFIGHDMKDETTKVIRTLMLCNFILPSGWTYEAATGRFTCSTCGGR